MARGNPTGFPLTQNETEGGRGLTKGSIAGETLSLMELLHNLETWVKLRGVVSAPANLPTTGMLDGDLYVVWESAGVGSPPALYIYNIDTTTWVNVTSTGVPANHASTHYNDAADPLLDAVTAYAISSAVAAADKIVVGTGGAPGIILTFSTVVGIRGRSYLIFKGDAAVGAITVAAQGGQTINGAASLTLPNQYDSILVESDNVGWVAVRPASLFHRAHHLPGGMDALIVPPTVPGAYPYVLQVTDEVVLASSGGAPVAITLHTAVGFEGKRYVFKKIDAPAFAVNVTPAGAEVIENLAPGAAYALAARWDTVTLESNGVGWNVINAHPVPAAHALTHRPAGVDELLDPITSPPAGAYVVLATDKYVRCDSGGAGVAATLYAAGAGAVGRTITFIKIDVAGFAIAVTPNGAELINGVNAPVALAAQWNSVTLKCVAVGQWEVIALTP